MSSATRLYREALLLDPNDLAEVLAKYIPKIIDELTPSGQVQRRH